MAVKKQKAKKKSKFQIVVKGIKIFFIFILLSLILLFAFNYEMAIYGLQQLKGQVSVIWGAEPIEEVLKSDLISEEEKQKLIWINEIREFAFEELGINFSENYTTFYNQKDKPILWAVSACEAYQFKNYEWTFPVLGTFSYKGFFDKSKAEKEIQKLDSLNYDTDLGEVAGWSTLGFFKDPVLSSMLRRSEGSLANLIIHELTHGTLYIKNNVNFNENLANFIGDKGAELYLKKKYGENSEQLLKYKSRIKDEEIYTKHVLKKKDELAALYENFPKFYTNTQKDSAKFQQISQFVYSITQLNLQDKEGYFLRSKRALTERNAFFMDYERYSGNQVEFEKDLNENFNGNLKNYLTHLKQKYPKEGLQIDF